MAARLALGLVVLALAACGGIQVAPTPELPRALVRQLPLVVGVIVPQDMLDYKHQETRGGVTWQIALGEGHRKFAADVMRASFATAQSFKTLDEAKAAANLAVIFEPRIQQYSFATARDTGSNYYAATIQYRIVVYNPAGQEVDAFSLTGYGNSLVGGALQGSSEPLAAATRAAMRDAAAKFMVQFPEQKLAQQLLSGAPLLAAATATGDAASIIEAVPIRD